MPTNDFLPFAISVGANVLDQTDYAALAAVGTGFTSGTAQSEQLNKVWRQGTVMANVVGDLIVEQTGQDALDDGTTATLLTNLTAAVTGRLINVQNFGRSGAGTFAYTPTANTKSILVEVQGGGGGGGGSASTSAGQAACGAGGAAGGYVKGRLTSGFSSGITVTVGAGGTGSSGASGSSGGTSVFGTVFTATGGTGGGVGSATAIPTVGTTNSTGGAGSSTGLAIATAQGGVGGVAAVVGSSAGYGAAGGTAAIYGGGAPPIFTSGDGNIAINGPGGGGGGGLSINGAGAHAGGSGSQGYVTVYEYA